MNDKNVGLFGLAVRAGKTIHLRKVYY